MVHGRGASDALNSWNRKLEYDYWAARLRESFRFEGVRKIAERRLNTAQLFMDQLDLENKAGDLEDMLLEQKLQKPQEVGGTHLSRMAGLASNALAKSSP